MFAVMVGGSVTHMTNNASRAAGELGTAIKLLYPKADAQRAMDAFRSGHSVVVGCVNGIVTGN
jgi:hypothetical protein